MTHSIKSCLRAALFATLVASPLLLVSAERRTAKVAREAAPAGETVELFAAIEAKTIEVAFVPKDSTEAKVTIKNKSGKPLNVKLPDAFAGVPVLAQNIGGRGGRGGQNGQGQGGGMNQGMGGGMGGGMMGGGMMGGGMGMGMMNIPAEKVAQFRVPTVCLEHGKREPRPGVAYQIKPLEALTTKPEVRELLTAFGKQHLNQRATQAAAWHLANGMNWEELATKQTENLGGINGPFFGSEELQAGMQMAVYSINQVEVKARSTAAKSDSSYSQSTKAAE